MFVAVWTRQEQTKTFANNVFVRVRLGVKVALGLGQRRSAYVLAGKGTRHCPGLMLWSKFRAVTSLQRTGEERLYRLVDA